MHRDYSQRLAARAAQIRAEELDTSLNREDIRIRKMAGKVAGEVHRMKAFVRLSSPGALVLYGFLKPRHRIGQHICYHFARRNEGIIVVLGNGGESWISLCRNGCITQGKGEGLQETLDRLKSALANVDGWQNSIEMEHVDVYRLWQAYYDSQYCPERKNLAAFRRRMPRRDQESAGMRLVQNKRNVSLDDFR
jgi:hypothetical protein